MISALTVGDHPALRSFGPVLRMPTQGPEYDILKDFVSHQLPAAKEGQIRTVFVEPRIEYGFPDAVVVYWDGEATQNWPSCRAELTKRDMRILHYIASIGPVDEMELRVHFLAGTNRSLDALNSAGVIWRKSAKWSIKPIRQVFAVRRLIAIEAKVNAWRRGFIQALKNTWFASESYFLAPRLPRANALLTEAKRLGIGVVTSGQSLNQANLVPRRERIPKSYASWLFNEWAWKSRH